jgi:NADH-quinone oxidoreductase subunit A
VLAAAEFAPVAILLAALVLVAGAILAATHLIGPRRSGPVKDIPYESGVDPIGDARRRFNVRFYLVAVLFLVFDVEIIFLYPWAVLFLKVADGSIPDQAVFESLGYGPGFLAASVGFFFFLLTVGFIYEWRKGVFRWD